MSRARLSCLLLAGMIPLSMVSWAFAEDRPERPNILLIVADDLGWADVGWHGGTFPTPHLDRLVREGVELDRHYVQPVCTPTRTALLSGRSPGRFARHALAPSNNRVFPPGTVTLASALKSLGYATHIAGKWHLGSKPEWGPNHYGFDHSYGSLTGAVDPWTHKYRPGEFEETWHRDLKIFHEPGNATELVASEVERWIRGTDTGKDRQSWFIYVPFHAIHIPVDAPEEYKKPLATRKFDDDPKKDDSLRRLAAMVMQLDAKVGQFVAALEETGQRKNTLIVFTSDNGGKESGGNPYVGNVAGSPANSSNLPLRGQKNQLYEGGIRVCAFANWPGHLPSRKLTAPMHAVDWFPTLAALVGYEPPQDLNWDGLDMWPVLTGKASPRPRTIYIPTTKGAALIHGDWKLIVSGKEQVELFHLAEDPYETQDLAPREPQRVAELQAILRDVRRDDAVK